MKIALFHIVSQYAMTHKIIYNLHTSLIGYEKQYYLLNSIIIKKKKKKHSDKSELRSSKNNYKSIN